MQTSLNTSNIEDACQLYSFWCVSRIKSIFSVIVYAIYGAICFYLTRFFFCDNMCILQHHTSQIQNMNYQPLFRSRARNNGKCRMNCYVLNSLITLFPFIVSQVAWSPGYTCTATCRRLPCDWKAAATNATTVRSKLHFSVADQSPTGRWQLSLEIGDQSATDRRLVRDWLPTDWKWVAIGRQLVGDWSATGQRWVGDWLSIKQFAVYV